MFKIPDWEGDVPKTNVNFVKNHKAIKRIETIVKTITNGRTLIQSQYQDSYTESVSGLLQCIANYSTAKHLGKKNKDKNNETAVVKSKPQILNGNKEKLVNSKPITNMMINGNDNIKPITQINNQKTLKNKKNNKKEKHSLKRKLPDSNIVNTKKKVSKMEEADEQNFDTDKPDEMLLNAGKNKLNKQIQNDDSEELLFSSHEQNNNFKHSPKRVSNGILPKIENSQTQPKPDKKKQLIKTLLQKESQRRHIDISSNGNKLRERMLERLKAAQFRYLNEKLYTTSGTEAQQLFQSDPVAFQTYHEGYQQQVKKWPVKPLDVIVKKIMKMPKSHLVADMGCGEAELSKRVQQEVRSFDLVAASPNVEACDMAHTPLLSASVDVAVYCLALMGTDLTQYLVEGNRILKVGGFLLIAEVESRFDDVESFAKEVQRLGFKMKGLDKSNQVFFFMEFIKTQDPPVKKSKLPELKLKPCLYKKR